MIFRAHTSIDVAEWTRRLKVGDLVVIAGHLVERLLPGYTQYPFNAKPADVGVEGCAEVFRRFESDEAARAFLASAKR